MFRHFFSKTGRRSVMGSSEDRAIDPELSPPFTVLRPERLGIPYIFNSPHSGRVYPRAFLAASRLDATALRKSEDSFVEELFASAPGLGAPLMHAHFPRAYLDLNREPYELDPALIADALPGYANTQSVRVVGGLGTIARVVTESEEIYRAPLLLDEALARIDALYKPYHDALAGLMFECRRDFGVAVLIDCHSMPSNPAGESGGPRPDFVLGDRFSTSCDTGLTRAVAQALRAMGYVVALNKPYAGGYITEHYGHPADGFHALQIEINRALYMDEASFTKLPGFRVVEAHLGRLVAHLGEFSQRLLEVPRAAAE